MTVSYARKKVPGTLKGARIVNVAGQNETRNTIGHLYATYDTVNYGDDGYTLDLGSGDLRLRCPHDGRYRVMATFVAYYGGGSIDARPRVIRVRNNVETEMTSQYAEVDSGIQEIIVHLDLTLDDCLAGDTFRFSLYNDVGSSSIGIDNVYNIAGNDVTSWAEILDLRVDVAAGLLTGAPKDPAYLLLTAADSVLPNERVLTAGGGMTLTDGGAGSSATMSWNGLLTKKNGVTVGTRRNLNFIEGSNVTLTVEDDGTDIDVTIIGASGVSGLTAGRIPFATNSTTLVDDDALLWDNSLEQLRIFIDSTPAAAHIPSNLKIYIARDDNFGGVAAQTSSGTQGHYSAWLSRRSRGTAAVPTMVQSGDKVAAFETSAFDGTTYASTAYILMTVDDTTVSGQRPASRIDFLTSANNQSLATRLTIDRNGDVFTPAGATNMTAGFISIPAAAGAPSGTPTAHSGTVPLYFNTSTDTLYAYDGGWVTVGGGGGGVATGDSPTWTGTHTFNPGTAQATPIILGMAQPVAAGTRDSHILRFVGTSFDTSGHDSKWEAWVDVTTNAGASAFRLTRQIDAGTVADVFYFNPSTNQYYIGAEHTNADTSRAINIGRSNDLGTGLADSVMIGFSSSIANGALGSVGIGSAVTVDGGASGTSVIAIGDGAATASDSVIAIGAVADAGGNDTGPYGIAIGYFAYSGGAASIAFGKQANIPNSNDYSIAVGSNTNVSHDESIALGRGATTSANNQMVVGGTGAITDVYIGNGVTAASPSAFALNATGGSGTNVAGAALTIAGGRGTGNVAGGSILFKTSHPDASGTTLNALTTLFTMDSASGLYGPAGATGMTKGFIFIPAAAGAPSGTPTNPSGQVPLYFDTTNNKLYVYDGGWLSTAALT